MRLKLFALAAAATFILFHPLALKAQGANPLTIEEAIRFGLTNNYQLLVSQNEATIGLNNNTAGQAGLLPIVSADFTYLRREENVRQQFATGGSQERNGAGTRLLSGGIGLNYTVFNGFGTFASRTRLAAVSTATLLQQKDLQQTVALQISEAYYNIIRQKQLIDVAREGLQLSRLKLQIARDRYEVGSSSKYEYLQAETDYRADSANLLRQQVSLRSAVLNLNYIIARNDPAEYATADTIELAPRLDRDAIEREAETGNSSLLVARNQLSVADADLKLAQAALYPNVGVNARYNFTNQRAEAGLLLINQTAGFNYGLTATWNIFNGGIARRQVDNSKLIRQSAELQVSLLESDIDTRVNVAFQEYDINLTLVDLERSNLEYARQNLDLAEERFRIGRINIIEFREAQLSYVNARTRFLESVYSAKVSEMRLLRLAGRLY